MDNALSDGIEVPDNVLILNKAECCLQQGGGVRFKTGSTDTLSH